MYLKGRKQNAELHYQEGEQEKSIQMYLGNSVVKRREIHLGAATKRSPSHGLRLHTVQEFLKTTWSNIRYLNQNCFNSPLMSIKLH